jgi:hypothetical protein
VRARRGGSGASPPPPPQDPARYPAGLPVAPVIELLEVTLVPPVASP